MAILRVCTIFKQTKSRFIGLHPNYLPSISHLYPQSQNITSPIPPVDANYTPSISPYLYIFVGSTPGLTIYHAVSSNHLPRWEREGAHRPDAKCLGSRTFLAAMVGDVTFIFDNYRFSWDDTKMDIDGYRGHDGDRMGKQFTFSDAHDDPEWLIVFRSTNQTGLSCNMSCVSWFKVWVLKKPQAQSSDPMLVLHGDMAPSQSISRQFSSHPNKTEVFEWPMNLCLTSGERDHPTMAQAYPEIDQEHQLTSLIDEYMGFYCPIYWGLPQSMNWEILIAN